MVAADPAVWTMAALSAVAGGLHPDTDSADRRWLIIATPAWQELLRRAGSADKAALRIASGAGAVALCRTPERRPAWERFEPTVGDRLDVVALICRRRQLAAALVEARSVSDGVQRVLAQAQHAPAGCSYHWLTGLDSVLPTGLAAAERSVTIIVPGAAAVPTAGGPGTTTGCSSACIRRTESTRISDRVREYIRASEETDLRTRDPPAAVARVNELPAAVHLVQVPTHFSPSQLPYGTTLCTQELYLRGQVATSAFRPTPMPGSEQCFTKR